MYVLSGMYVYQGKEETDSKNLPQSKQFRFKVNSAPKYPFDLYPRRYEIWSKISFFSNLIFLDLQTGLEDRESGEEQGSDTYHFTLPLTSI